MSSETVKSGWWRRILRNLRRKRKIPLEDPEYTYQSVFNRPLSEGDTLFSLRPYGRRDTRGSKDPRYFECECPDEWDQRNLSLFTKGQRGLRLDPFFTGLFHFFNAHQGVVDPCVRTSSCKDAQKRFVENISPRINGPIWILHGFLSAKGLFKGDFKAFKESLQKLWFEPFNRSGGTVLDSSAFEHVFLGEITKKGDVTGLHNWMRMYDDELGGRFNLTENAKYYPTGKPFISDVKFTWNGYTKKQGTTFFMKKSPAVEIALYTLCFNVRRNISCPTISFGAGVVKVMAKPLAGNKNLISAAYPEFP